jgi:hypothetical protein
MLGACASLILFLTASDDVRALVNGEIVSPDEQERRGLVEVGGCSGALLTNRVAITAKHCIQENDFYAQKASNVQIRAAWGTQSVKGAKYFFADYDLVVITLDGPIVVRGSENGFRQPLWLGNPGLNGQVVVAYGMGPYEFARKVGVPTMVNGKLVEIGEIGEQPSHYDDKYRKANADVSDARDKSYYLNMRAGRQIGGGDSGGPSFLGDMLTGVHSGCQGDRMLEGHPRPTKPGDWMWTAETWHCTDSSVAPARGLIDQAIGTTSSPLTREDMVVQRHQRAISAIRPVDTSAPADEVLLRRHHRPTSRMFTQTVPNSGIRVEDNAVQRHDRATSRRILDVARADPQPAPPAPHPATCKSGYVWRVARADDLVCVTPQSRARIALENRTAGERTLPGGRCKSGFVWREAFYGDGVCVTPQIRALVREENRIGPSLRATAGPVLTPADEARLRRINRLRREQLRQRDEGPIVR